MNLNALFLFTLLLVPPAAAETTFLDRHPPVADAVKVLELWLEEQLAHQELPGIAVGVVHDQELVWAEGYGYSDLATRTPMRPSTLFRMGSITKLFTATAILQLRDAGKLRLDDPISAYLPWFSVESSFEGAPPITVRQLLTHTSGLPREAAFPYWTDHEFPDREAVIAALPGQSAIYEPATTYKYSNLGIALLGEIVTAVSGQPYEEYVREKILEPLGMSSSTLLPGEEHHRRRATSYMRRQDGERKVFEYYDTGALRPAANLVSSVEDLARFAQLHFRLEAPRAGGEQILKGSTLREMQRPHWVHPSWNGGRGLGFSISRRDGKTIVSHGGWIGGNRTHLLLVPDDKIAVIVMINADDGSPSFFAYRILDALAPAIVEATAKPAPPKKQAEPGWQRYVGTYSDPWGWEYRALIVDGQLVFYESNYPPEDAPGDGLNRLEWVAEHTFRMGDGELVVFELDEEGQVERVQRRYDYLYPVDAVDTSPHRAEVHSPGSR